jgi:hypothetical protein
MKQNLFQISGIIQMFAAQIVLYLVFYPAGITAEVKRIEITSSEVQTAEITKSPYGPYEVIKGILYFEVDPDLSANQQIVDLKLAPRNDQGNVEFSTEFELHKPVNAEPGNHRLLYGVVNRGNKFAESHFSAGYGSNWLYSQGWSYLYSGWGGDVINSDRKLNIDVPVATENGETIVGEVYCEMINYEDEVVYSQPLVWGGSIPYSPTDLDDPDAVLSMRPYRWEEPVSIPREQWAFARIVDGTLSHFLDMRRSMSPVSRTRWPGWLSTPMHGDIPSLRGY